MRPKLEEIFQKGIGETIRTVILIHLPAAPFRT